MMKSGAAQSRSKHMTSTAQPIGQLLLNKGKLAEPDIARIIAVQKRANMLFGEVAVRLGLATHADVQNVLAFQKTAYPSVIADLEAFNPILVTVTSPHSAPSEAFRTLRSELTLRWKSAKRKLLTITSSRPGEGASVLAANLGVVFAQAGQRTLMIDANLREPVQHEIFRIENTPGLSAVLNGHCEIQDAIRSIVPIDKLCVMPSGVRPSNPQELLSKPAFLDLIMCAYAEFDVVIFDSPPILDVADARMICSQTGSCLLAVRRDVTKILDVNKAKAALAPTRAVLVGAVISD